MDFIKGYTGQEGFVILVGLILVIPGLVFFICRFRQRTTVTKNIFFVVLFIIGVTLIWQIDIPEEKIHILEYGILGWLATRDLWHKDKRAAGVILACIFCLLTGLTDESFQGILPYRFFQWSDVMLNGLGGVWGVGLFISS